MICHDLKTVFLHIPKTAGQSIEQAVLEEVGLTWKNRLPLLLSYNSNPEVGPPRLAHLTRNQYLFKKYISFELWQEYFKFSFVRNPWDRAVSFYRYMDPKRQHSFSKFLKNKLQTKLWEEKYWFVKPQYEFLKSPDGDLDVDYIGNFETLNQDFNEIAQIIGLTNKNIPKKNISVVAGKKKKEKSLNEIFAKFNERRHGNHKRQAYRDYFGATEKRIVDKLYEVDIENFGYKF